VPGQTVEDFIMNDSIDRLRCHFGLTLAEARLALHLVGGETLRSAAVNLSTTYETARTLLKKIFSKTETCRQAELVLVILTALPECLEAVSSSAVETKWSEGGARL
jgi:DNA-binding CsgD family transcriptional regulator